LASLVAAPQKQSLKQNSIDAAPKPFFTIDPDYWYTIGVTFLPLNILIDIDQLGS
tara:strand:+ start:1126 stop:1290 length:165 start_codon:yes stop_codon:yes gene_type:complete